MPGDAWACTLAGQTTSAAGTYAFAIDQSFSVKDAGSVSVPAGTWDTMSLSVTVGSTTATSWTAPGVGTIVDSHGELVSLFE